MAWETQQTSLPFPELQGGDRGFVGAVSRQGVACRSVAASIQYAAEGSKQNESVSAPKLHRPRTFRQISDHGTEVSIRGNVVSKATWPITLLEEGNPGLVHYTH